MQPLRPHQHWHVDISYLNLSGTFYYLCSVLDGASRVIVHFEVRERMTELDVECILQRAREKYPKEHPQIITDNGPQFIAGEFKNFIRMCGMTHVRTSVGYPQSNGKLERWHRSVKSEALRPANPTTVEEAIRNSGGLRASLQIACDCTAPWTILRPWTMNGLSAQIWAERDRRLEEARARRAQRRAQLHALASPSPSAPWRGPVHERALCFA